jgi:fibronectin type 3 domain-containing protein
MTAVKRYSIALVAMACVLTLGLYYYPTQSQQPVEPLKPHKVTVSWDKTPRAKSYNVYRRPYRSDAYIKVGSSETNSYEDSDVKSEEIYCYEVTSIDSKGNESKRSKEICITVPHP